MSLQLNTTLPNLFVSQSQLSFDPTNVGDERFAVIRIGQEGSDVPIRVVSEVAQFFQIAVQANPLRFGAEATFTPSPGGTFIHVRYAPKQTGRHAGELIIEAGQATQTIGLLGRTTGLLARLSPQTSLAPASRQQVLAAPRPDYTPTESSERSSSKRPWLTIALAVGLVGGGALTYWGVTHPNAVRRWLPAATKESAKAAPVDERATPSSQLATAPVAISPKVRTAKRTRALTKKQSRQANEDQKIAMPLVKPSGSSERNVVERKELPQPEQTQVRTEQARTEKPPVRIVSPVATRPVTERSAAATPKKKPVPVRAKPTENPTAESDLERELNKNQ